MINPDVFVDLIVGLIGVLSVVGMNLLLCLWLLRG